jgi:hypothetical protein
MAAVEFPLRPSPDPPAPVGGAQGPKGHRPSEKKIESKDVIKEYGESVSFGKRHNLPRGMVFGGGSSDFAVRSFANSDYLKALTWVNNAAPYLDSSSMYLRGLGLIGPLSAISAVADAAAGNGLDQSASGIPINCDAIRRALGGLTYKTFSRVQYLGVATNTVTIASTISVPGAAEGGVSELTSGWRFTLAAAGAGAPPTTWEPDGIVDIERTVRFVPSAAVAGGGSSDMKGDITVSNELTITITPSTGAPNSVEAIGAASLPSIAITKTAIKTLTVTKTAAQNQILLLNLYGALNVAADGTHYIRLQDSRGYTVACHDGLMFDSYQ